MGCSWTPVALGPAGPKVVPLGLASSFGLGGGDVERAFDRGLNLFYWGSRRTWSFGRGLKTIAARSRERVVLVIQSYSRRPAGLGSSLETALRRLRVDFADVLLLGWWNLPPPERMLDAAADLVRRGRARQVMVSCHHRPTFPVLARDPRVQLLMIRYNAAHPGAEQDVFPHLPTPRPGVVTYTATCWGQLIDPSGLPEGVRPPTATDCYRFALSNPTVDACYTAPADGRQLDAALEALNRGPLSDEEQAWMRQVGSVVRERSNVLSAGLKLGDRFINLVSGFGFRDDAELRRGQSSAPRQ